MQRFEDAKKRVNNSARTSIMENKRIRECEKKRSSTKQHRKERTSMKEQRHGGHGPKKPRGGVCFLQVWEGMGSSEKTYDFDGVDGVRSANQRARDGVLRRRQAQSRKKGSSVLGENKADRYYLTSQFCRYYLSSKIRRTGRWGRARGAGPASSLTRQSGGERRWRCRSVSTICTRIEKTPIAVVLSGRQDAQNNRG